MKGDDRLELKRVTKEEYEAFLQSYPRKLLLNVTGICEPPAINHYDLSLGEHALVAHTFAYSDDPSDYWYESEEERWYEILA